MGCLSLVFPLVRIQSDTPHQIIRSHMTKERLTLLFELCEELYTEEQKRTGLFILPFVWAIRDNPHGQLLVFSSFGHDSRKLAVEIGIPWKTT